MDPKRRQQFIERYSDGIRAVVISIEHLKPEELDLRPEAKAWSARQVVHHLADAELHESLNLRRMLAENTPVLSHWDAERWADRLYYDRPIEASLDMFRATAIASLELLRGLSEEQWRRGGNQQRAWPQTVEGWLEDRVQHVHDQLMNILNAPSGGRVRPDPH